MSARHRHHKKRAAMSRPRREDTPLSCKIEDGVLVIEIGVDTNAFAALRSEYLYGLMGPEQQRPNFRFRIRDATGFARDVMRELLAEAEDGSSLLTRLLDDACQQAIEQGSEDFVDSEHDE